MALNLSKAATEVKIGFAPKTPNRWNVPPEQRIEEALRRNMVKKFEAEMQKIMDKPASERTLDEKIKLASYKTAQGLMDMKNYPPVIY